MDLQMERRPKRTISKPSRYKTTSSEDDSPQKRRNIVANAEDIDKDIDDLRKISHQRNMDNEKRYSFPTSHTLMQNQTSYTHTYIPNETNKPHTIIQPQIPVQLYSKINNKAHTDIQSHTNIEAYDINSKTYTDLHPRTNIQIHSGINSQTHTDIPSHTNTEAHDINNQTHTDIQPLSHASIQSYNTNNLAHTNSQSNITKTYPSLSHNPYDPSVSHNILQACPSPNYTRTESEKTIHPNNVLLEFQDARTLSSHSSIHNESDQGSARSQHFTSTHTDRIDNRSMYNCVQRVEAELKRMNTLLEKIFKCVQDRRYPSQKPDILPISTFIEMDRFERSNEEDYSNVINYLTCIGGFNLKEAVNLCFKEAITDALTPSFTWWGREEGHRPLYNARITMAIYEAVCSNQHFQKPTRSEFQIQFREALRTAKERLRHKTRMRTINHERRNINRDLWSDERPEETNED